MGRARRRTGDSPRTRALLKLLDSELGEGAGVGLLRFARWSEHRDGPTEANLTTPLWIDRRLYGALLEQTTMRQADRLRQQVETALCGARTDADEAAGARDSGTRARAKGLPAAEARMQSTPPPAPSQRVPSEDELSVAADPRERETARPPARDKRSARVMATSPATVFTERATFAPDAHTDVLIWTWDQHFAADAIKRLPDADSIVTVGDIVGLRRALAELVGQPPVVVIDARWVRADEPVELQAADLESCTVILWGAAPDVFPLIADTLSRARRLVTVEDSAPGAVVVDICAGLCS